MNQRNVEALARAIRDITKEAISSLSLTAEQWAAELASRGVLVPSALTDREATMCPPFDCGFISVSERDKVEPAKRNREALARIAKGEG